MNHSGTEAFSPLFRLFFYSVGLKNEDILQAFLRKKRYNSVHKEVVWMKKEVKTVVYDDELRLEAYRFDGVVQPFPNHFHEYYVIGFMEGGERRLSCKNKEYFLKKGHIVLFNPGDNHACSPINGSTLDYRGLNIPKDIMLELAREVTGKAVLPGFAENVIQDEEIACYLCALHGMIMEGGGEFGKEENLLLLISLLLQRYGQLFEDCALEYREEIEKACVFIDEHFAQPICLEQLCGCAGLSKSTLLRAFTKCKGVTPYLYLENVRISAAKKLLETGATPLEAAMQTGFSDQSHFTNYFNRFIGLSPGMYREIFADKRGTEAKNHGR